MPRRADYQKHPRPGARAPGLYPVRRRGDHRAPRANGRQRRIDRSGEYLSGGEAQLIAIARALLMHPKLVMMDELSQGLAPKIVEDATAIIQGIRDEGIAILLVEQNSSLALGMSDRAYVIDDGRIVHTSRAADLEANLDLKHRLLAV